MKLNKKQFEIYVKKLTKNLLNESSWVKEKKRLIEKAKKQYAKQTLEVNPDLQRMVKQKVSMIQRSKNIADYKEKLKKFKDNWK